MVLLNDVVEVFRLNNTDDPANPREFADDAEILQTSKISAILVDDNVLWDTVSANATIDAAAPNCHVTETVHLTYNVNLSLCGKSLLGYF